MNFLRRSVGLDRDLYFLEVIITRNVCAITAHRYYHTRCAVSDNEQRNPNPNPKPNPNPNPNPKYLNTLSLFKHV